MKGLILSGGKATRLRPITHTWAKQLIPIANKPILFYGLEQLKSAGIEEVGIVVGDTKEEIMKACGSGKFWGLKITYIFQEAPLGLAHAVKISRDFLGKDKFVMYLGDNLVKEEIKPLVKKFANSSAAAQILLAPVEHPEQFGVAEIKDDKIIRLVEKPKVPPTNLALVGIYMFNENIFSAVENIKPSWRGELEITEAIQYLIDHQDKVLYHIISGWWKDTGKLEDLLEANRIMIEDIVVENKGIVEAGSKLYGKVKIEKGAKIINSIIRGPVVIGENTQIVNSYIGPFTSIYYGVYIEDSEIEHSIILEQSKITGIKRIEDSLIGQRVEVVKSKAKPQAYRLMVGDSSRVEVI